MIWVLLFSIIFNSDNTLFLIPKVNNHIKTVVHDQGKRDAYKSIEQNIKAYRKAFIKKQKQHRKDLQRLNLSYHSKAEDYQMAIDRFTASLDTLAKKELATRIKITELFSKEESQQLIVLLHSDIIKQQKKVNKHQEKFKKKWDKTILGIANDFNTHPKSTNIKCFLKENKQQFYKHIDNYQACFLPRNTDILDPDFSNEEVAELLNMSMTIKDEMARSIIELRFYLNDLVEEDDWKKMAKQLNKVL